MQEHIINVHCGKGRWRLLARFLLVVCLLAKKHSTNFWLKLCVHTRTWTRSRREFSGDDVCERFV